eukprot:CAMPEP_0170566714 /NCGR_PEP_ID=MMETSP0211-20121228/80018_1 /TAXON_ID=311385 /ORGANISM="Pseudokeronopsis sp., Strain OXSARD2" /LENGTH=77 /DNA_ID=CAMNT_0010887967 /DNA_START=228 /DNA_END=461 /DNA_ORIENTATION=-
MSRHQSQAVSESFDENLFALNKGKPSKDKEDLMRMTANSSLSSLYEIPVDRPLGLDFQKYINSGSDLQYDGNDIEII